MRTITKIQDFKSADKVLQGRNRESKKVGNNTYLRRIGENIALRLHNTDIVTYYPNGTIMLTTGGYWTNTTRDRLNEYTPFAIWTDRGKRGIRANGKSYTFFDGITFGPKGGCKNPLTKTANTKYDAKVAKAKREIKAYVDGWIENLITGQMPNPSGGDCWYCAMFPEMEGEGGHLRDHMEEQYYVPSLLMKAIKAKGSPNPVVYAQFALGIGSVDGYLTGGRANIKGIRQILTKYMQKHLLERA